MIAVGVQTQIMMGADSKHKTNPDGGSRSLKIHSSQPHETALRHVHQWPFSFDGNGVQKSSDIDSFRFVSLVNQLHSLPE